jgi:hypothetical protein
MFSAYDAQQSLTSRKRLADLQCAPVRVEQSVAFDDNKHMVCRETASTLSGSMAVRDTKYVASNKSSSLSDECSVYASAAPPYGIRGIVSVIGRPSLDILKSGCWQKMSHTSFRDRSYRPTGKEIQWCEWIDAIRLRLYRLSATTTQSKTCFRLTADHADAPLGIEATGMTVTGIPSPRAFVCRTKPPSNTANRKELLHLFVSKEETLLIPFLYGLDYVTVASVSPGDYVITSNGRPLSIIERKREDDLSSGIGKRFADQRERLKRVSEFQILHLCDSNQPLKCFSSPPT